MHSATTCLNVNIQVELGLRYYGVGYRSLTVDDKRIQLTVIHGNVSMI